MEIKKYCAAMQYLNNKDRIVSYSDTNVRKAKATSYSVTKAPLSKTK